MRFLLGNFGGAPPLREQQKNWSRVFKSGEYYFCGLFLKLRNVPIDGYA
jgi:hypothetical protein